MIGSRSRDRCGPEGDRTGRGVKRDGRREAMATDTKTEFTPKEAIYRRTISDLLEALEPYLDELEDPLSNPEGNAAIYWARAVLNPEGRMNDHPIIAEQLQVLLK
jgi:hypothetical protein